MPIKVLGEEGAAALAEAIKNANTGVDRVGGELTKLSSLVNDAMEDLDTSEMTAEEVEAAWNS